MTDLQREAVEAVRYYIDLANEIYGLKLDIPEISFNMVGQNGGRFKGNISECKVIYNRILLEENGKAFIDQTVPHEIAHYIVYKRYGCKFMRPKTIKSHGYEWQKIMKDFGCKINRCHNFDTSNSEQGRRGRTQSKYIYGCACQEHELGETRHRRIQYEGAIYTCRKCKTKITKDTFKKQA